MRWIIILICFGFVFTSYAQEKGMFLLKGIILSPDSATVEDAYVINFRDAYMYNSNSSGRFNIWVQPGDSLMVSHISYKRKIIYADSVRKNSTILLEYEIQGIGQVNIHKEAVDEKANLEKNMKQIKNSIPPSFKDPRAKYENYDQFITEHNRLFRNEASSVTFLRISPSTVISKWIKKQKAGSKKGISSTRKKNEASKTD